MPAFQTYGASPVTTDKRKKFPGFAETRVLMLTHKKIRKNYMFLFLFCIRKGVVLSSGETPFPSIFCTTPIPPYSNRSLRTASPYHHVTSSHSNGAKSAGGVEPGAERPSTHPLNAISSQRLRCSRVQTALALDLGAMMSKF